MNCQERYRLRQDWQRHVTLGEAKREVQLVHPRHLLDWIYAQFRFALLSRPIAWRRGPVRRICNARVRVRHPLQLKLVRMMASDKMLRRNFSPLRDFVFTHFSRIRTARVENTTARRMGWVGDFAF